MEAVLPHLSVRDKKTALKTLAAQAAKLSGLNEKEIYGVMLEREHIGCTGMGNGVCIPHGRFEGLKSLHAVFAHLDKPIEFGAADGRPVDLIFMLLTPANDNTGHLKALASISRLLRDKQLVSELRKSKDARSIYDLLTTQRDDE